MEANKLLIPISIIIAGIIIGGALFLKPSNTSSPLSDQGQQQKRDSQSQESDKSNPVSQQQSIEDVLSITSKDHMLGNPEAPVKIISYTDLECPHCQKLHQIMQKIMNDYATAGKVAWVVRQFPIKQLHPNSPEKARVGECVASLEGDVGFWKFLNNFFNETPSNGSTSVQKTKEIAQNIGNINKESLNECLSKEQAKKTIQQNLTEGKKAGVNGTPISFLISKEGRTKIMGPHSYKYIKEKIETVLKN